jgi:hypothetical protein
MKNIFIAQMLEISTHHTTSSSFQYPIFIDCTISAAPEQSDLKELRLKLVRI